MRVYLNRVPETEGFQPEAQGWRAIRQPGARLSYALAGLAGLTIPAALCIGVSILSWPSLRNPGAEPAPTSPVAWGAVLAALLLFIPLHELLHALCYPDGGLSDRTCLVIWPLRLHFGVYYEGCLSRARWLVMRAAPLLVLSLLPACTLVVWRNLPWALMTFLQVLLLVNGIGSGGDVIALLLILLQLPASAQLCFCGGRAYWRP